MIIVASNWGSYLVCPFFYLRCGILLCLSANVYHDRYILVFGSSNIIKMWNSTHAAPWSNYLYNDRDKYISNQIVLDFYSSSILLGDFHSSHFLLTYLYFYSSITVRYFFHHCNCVTCFNLNRLCSGIWTGNPAHTWEANLVSEHLVLFCTEIWDTQ
jgi:hypothetical protein